MKDGRPFGVGGIWERWQQGDQRIESCAVITRQADNLVRPINDRMPVIIAKEDYGPWLDPQFYDVKELQRMMRECSPDLMIVTPSR